MIDIYDPRARNIVSVSGGKDSTALLLLAKERDVPNLQAVFADTGHEHPQTYEYIAYLDKHVHPIRTIRPDFTEQIARKAKFVAEKWRESLSAEMTASTLIDVTTGQPILIRKYSDEWIDDKVKRALAILKPTGIPFLDLCIWKGRFPSTRARFCSEELKRNPIMEQVHMPLMDDGLIVVSWQGVRADESASRAALSESECVGGTPNGGEIWNYRPILRWTAADAFAMHRKYGVKPNLLYMQGMGRVGCMPCIHARKDELLEIARRFPEEIERVAEWERLVSEASKCGCSTFFEADTIPGNSREMSEIRHETHGIWQAVEWSKTGRGGVQYDLLRVHDDGPLCSSIYGLCE